MNLVEQQSEQLTGVLPKSYTDFSDELLGELLRIILLVLIGLETGLG